MVPKRVILLAALSLASLAQGIADFGWPALTGGALFGPSRFVASLGAPALFFWLLVHNVGLAALLPGVGFGALTFERSHTARRLVAHILFGAMVGAMVTSVLYIAVGPGTFDLRVAIPLVALEWAGILALAWPAYRRALDLARGWPEASALRVALRTLRRPWWLAVGILSGCAVGETLNVLF